MLYLIIGILLLGGFVFYQSSCKNKSISESKTNPAGQDTATSTAQQTTANIYSDLRGMAFGMTPEKLQISLPADQPIVFGVIMDWGIDTATATLVAYKTGDASMYLSTGGGVIGGGQHQNASSAAKQYINLAQAYLDKSTKSDNNILPQRDEVKFYLLTNKGTFAGQDVIKNFENSTSAWLPLFEEANKVLTELRLISKN